MKELYTLETLTAFEPQQWRWILKLVLFEDFGETSTTCFLALPNITGSGEVGELFVLKPEIPK